MKPLTEQELSNIESELNIDKQDVQRLINNIRHWKHCCESEQKIAGRLQRKVEELEKKTRLYKDIADSCRCDEYEG